MSFPLTTNEAFGMVRHLCDRIAPEPWGDLRNNCAKAVRFYRGTHRSDVEALIRLWFPEAAKRDELKADVKNFVRKIVDRAASLWSNPVERTYLMGEQPISPDSAQDAALHAQDKGRMSALIRLDRRCYLCRSALLFVGWDHSKQILSYRIIAPSDVWIVPSSNPLADPDDLQSLDAVIYELQATGKTRRFCLWTHDTQLIYQGESVESPSLIEAPPEGGTFENPLGLLPFVFAREDDAEGYFFPPYSEDLIDSAASLNISETLQRRNVHYQSHGQMVVPEGTNLQQPIGAGVAWVEPQAYAGQTRFLTKDTPFAAVDSQIQREIQTLASTRDLPPNDFALAGGKAPESGFAKVMDSLPLLDLRKARIMQVGQPVEEDLVTVETAVLSYYSGVPFPKGLGVTVEFPGPDFPRSAEEEAQERKAKREAQQIEIAMGLLSAAQILAEEEGISIEEAEERVAANRLALVPVPAEPVTIE